MNDKPIRVVVLPVDPWVHALNPNPSGNNVNKTLCGIERSIPRLFLETKVEFFDISRSDNTMSNLRGHICGICWWKYTYGDGRYDGS